MTVYARLCVAMHVVSNIGVNLMASESDICLGKSREPLCVIGVSGQRVILGKPDLNLSMYSDPRVMLAARRKAHKKAVETVMAHRDQLLRSHYFF